MADTTPLLETQCRPPCCVRMFFNILVQVVSRFNEKAINIEVVVESFRCLFFIGFLGLTLLGICLTKMFVTVDHQAIIMDVFGGPNACSYLDFPPATYVMPFVWVFPLIFGIIYNVVSMFRIWIAHEEAKIGVCAKRLLWFAHIYFIVSLMYFSTCFAVQPDRKVPVTMIVHTVPYANLKLALCILQFAVVWFGGKVSWNEIMANSECCSRNVFMTLSWVHVFLQWVVMIVSQILIINALADMGPSNLKGKGLWWDVRGPGLLTLWEVTTNKGSFILGCILPLIQSVYLASRSITSVSETHTVNFFITDNRKSNVD